MKYLIDTDIASNFAKNISPKLKKRGLMQTKSEKVEVFFTQFLSNVTVLDFDEGDARESGRILAELSAAGKHIGDADTLIAGQAIANQLILVTNNTKHFLRVKGLQLENWMK